MQAPFLDNEETVKLFRVAISETRFARYLSTSNGEVKLAVGLYHWNTELSKSLYSSLQMWEVVLRNKLNAFLCWKYTANWPYDEKRALRQLTSGERKKLNDAIDRQRQLRGIKHVPTDAIVADLSAGFWVSLMSKSYEVPFSWRYNLARICPKDSTISRAEFFKLCGELLDLRNRVAHHEPVYHLPLEELRGQLDRTIGAMCSASKDYAALTCTFKATWNTNPLS